MITNEEWKPVKGYEDCYEVSNCGRVKSVSRLVSRGKTKPLKIPEHILSPFDNGRGYLVVSFKKDGIRKNHYVHRLVAEAFIDNPDGKEDVNHKDYNRHNNNVANLEWMTRKENIHYSLANQPKRKKYRTSSGIRYITKRHEKYRVNIVLTEKNKIDKSFKTVEEAIAFRNLVFAEMGEVVDE